jgi:ATP-dependent Clp protease ATP-binding subunit ClpA
MFDRFTTRARRALFHARSEVSQLGSSAIEPEHVLLGVIDEDNGLGCRILSRTGHTLDDFRSDIVRRLASRERVPESVEIPFSASCLRALQYAAEEADRLMQAIRLDRRRSVYRLPSDELRRIVCQTLRNQIQSKPTADSAMAPVP